MLAKDRDDVLGSNKDLRFLSRPCGPGALISNVSSIFEDLGSFSNVEKRGSETRVLSCARPGPR